jgi:hypothetical protein
MTADRGTRFYGPIAELDLGQARTVLDERLPGSPRVAHLLADGLEHRREQLRVTLAIPRIVGPADVAAPPCTWR